MVEQRFPLDYQHGRLGLQVNAPLDVIAGWSREDRLRAMSPQAFAFLDTETTGLSGGTGTYAFLIGVGRFWEGEFQLAQFFMRDPSEEPAQLHALEAFLAPCQAVVTFNGKAFDVPILNARFISQGLRSPFFDIAHVDLLPLARRLWRDRLPSRTLGNLEYQILGALRSEEDVPGWMVPSLYFDFLRSGDPHPLRGVFYHNSVDVISLAALFNYVAIRLADPLGGEAPHPVDEIAMAKLFEDLGDLAAATQLYLDGLARDLPLPNLVEAVERLARLYKRQGQLSAARELWEQAARHGSLDSCLALAKDCEHRLGDYPGAMEWTHLAIEVLHSSSRPAYQTAQLQAELEHRLQRLERKLAGS